MFEKLSKSNKEMLRVEHQKGMINNSIDFFSGQMKDEMLNHLDRPGWKKSTWKFLFGRLGEEEEELSLALLSFQRFKLKGCKGNEEEYFKLKKKIVKECADVANFAMMIADNFF